MTPNKEDYIKLIFELNGEIEQIPNKIIAEQLTVSAASVSEMLAKLSKDGITSYVPYKGVQLTEKGSLLAKQLIQRHCLWEVFLVEHLNYSWSDVHEEAELLEHVTSGKLASALEKYLGYPTICPHGSIIPRENGAPRIHATETMLDLEIGETAEISRVLEEKELLDYLTDIGIGIGCQVRLIAKAAYGGPLTLNVDEKKEVQINLKAIEKIFIRRIRNEVATE